MVHFLTVPWAIPVIFGCLVAVVAIITSAISATLKANAENALKKRMIEQGYTAAEIERVIRATSRYDEPCSGELPGETVPGKPPKQHVR